MAERNLRVFLDSNVLISGLISDRGAPRLLLDILSLRLPVLTAVTGAYNIAEVERNLSVRLPDALPVFRAVLSLMSVEMIPLPGKADLRRWAGSTADKDAPVLASAFMGKADVLVTGDKRHFPKGRRPGQPFEILSPAEFVDEVLPGFLKKFVP